MQAILVGMEIVGGSLLKRCIHNAHDGLNMGLWWPSAFYLTLSAEICKAHVIEPGSFCVLECFLCSTNHGQVQNSKTGVVRLPECLTMTSLAPRPLRNRQAQRVCASRLPRNTFPTFPPTDVTSEHLPNPPGIQNAVPKATPRYRG